MERSNVETSFPELYYVLYLLHKSLKEISGIHVWFALSNHLIYCSFHSHCLVVYTTLSQTSMAFHFKTSRVKIFLLLKIIFSKKRFSRSRQ